MLSSETRDTLKNKLLVRRRDIIDQNKKLQDVWQDIDFSAVEFQDRSQLETTSSSLGGLNRRQQEEIGIIDNALERMRQGSYGLCTGCGEQIQEKRLQAVPWAELCTECKDREERIQRRTSEPAREEEPAFFPSSDGAVDPSEYSDDELIELILERLEEGGLVDMEGVEIECENGLIRLSGVVPGEMQKEVLLSLLRDELGLTDIEDELAVTIDPSRGEEGEPTDFEDIDTTDDDLFWPGEGPDEEPI